MTYDNPSYIKVECLFINLTDKCMKEKTARRFLSRNKLKDKDMQPPSFLKRWKKAEKAVGKKEKERPQVSDTTNDKENV